MGQGKLPNLANLHHPDKRHIVENIACIHSPLQEEIYGSSAGVVVVVWWEMFISLNNEMLALTLTIAIFGGGDQGYF